MQDSATLHQMSEVKLQWVYQDAAKVPNGVCLTEFSFIQARSSDQIYLLRKEQRVKGDVRVIITSVAR